MPKISIEGLDKAEVVLALFENVYKKSESSKKRHAYAVAMTSYDIGIYSIPDKDEINDLLRKKSDGIKDLGSVELQLTFSGEIIDIDEYDTINDTGTNGTKKAADVIKELKPKPESKLSDVPSKLSIVKPTTTLLSDTSRPVITTATPQSINSDRRFNKSTKLGVLYEAMSIGFISDEQLKEYGITKWERQKDGLDNIVLVLEMAKPEYTPPATSTYSPY